MRNLILAGLAASTILFGATSASAATIINCASTTGQCINTDENVNLANGTNQPSVTGSTQNTGVDVLFTSVGNRLNSANGQAIISATDGVLDNLTFALLNGATFQTAFFNITPLNGQSSALETASVIFNFSDGTSSSAMAIGAGNNQFGVTAGAAGISSVTFTAAGAPTLGVETFRQLRLGGVTRVTAAVCPSPPPGQ